MTADISRSIQLLADRKWYETSGYLKKNKTAVTSTKELFQNEITRRHENKHVVYDVLLMFVECCTFGGEGYIQHRVAHLLLLGQYLAEIERSAVLYQHKSSKVIFQISIFFVNMEASQTLIWSNWCQKSKNLSGILVYIKSSTNQRTFECSEFSAIR